MVEYLLGLCLLYKMPSLLSLKFPGTLHDDPFLDAFPGSQLEWLRLYHRLTDELWHEYPAVGFLKLFLKLL